MDNVSNKAKIIYAALKELGAVDKENKTTSYAILDYIVEEWVDRFIKRGDINDGCRRMNEFFKFNKNMIGMYEELMRKKEEYIEIHNKNKKSGN